MTTARATPRLLALGLTFAATIWAAAIFFAPHSGFPGVAAIVHGTGSVVCHQRAERSFHIAQVPMPVCARCTGLYVAGALGALLGWLGTPRVPSRTRLLVGMMAVPSAVTFGGEWLGVLQPGNALRAAAALPLGTCAGWLFVRLLRAEEQPGTCAIIS